MRRLPEKMFPEEKDVLMSGSSSRITVQPDRPISDATMDGYAAIQRIQKNVKIYPTGIICMEIFLAIPERVHY